MFWICSRIFSISVLGHMAVQADGLLVDGGLVRKDRGLGHQTPFVDVAVPQQFLQAGIEFFAVSLDPARAVLLDLGYQRLDGLQPVRHIRFEFGALLRTHGHKSIQRLLRHRLHILP